MHVSIVGCECVLFTVYCVCVCTVCFVCRTMMFKIRWSLLLALCLSPLAAHGQEGDSPIRLESIDLFHKYRDSFIFIARDHFWPSSQPNTSLKHVGQCYQFLNFTHNSSIRFILFRPWLVAWPSTENDCHTALDIINISHLLNRFLLFALPATW